MDVSTFQLRT
jgi:hypothetical protein